MGQTLLPEEAINLIRSISHGYLTVCSSTRRSNFNWILPCQTDSEEVFHRQNALLWRACSIVDKYFCLYSAYHYSDAFKEGNRKV